MSYVRPSIVTSERLELEKAFGGDPTAVGRMAWDGKQWHVAGKATGRQGVI